MRGNSRNSSGSGANSGSYRQQGAPYNNRGGFNINQRQQGSNYNNRSNNQQYNPRPHGSNFSRPQHGSGGNVPEGSKFEIEVNYLDMKLNPKLTCAYHYDVKIHPDKPKKFMRPAFNKFCSAVFPDILIAYDGKASCYSIQKLDPNLLKEQTVTVTPAIGRPMELTVTLTETKDSLIDLTALKRLVVL